MQGDDQKLSRGGFYIPVFVRHWFGRTVRISSICDFECQYFNLIYFIVMHDAPHILLFYWKSSNLLDFHKVYFMYTKIYCFMRFSFGSMVYEYRFDSAFLQKFCFLCYFFFFFMRKSNITLFISIRMGTWAKFVH